uniref:Uncharacterized protein n=1 Tax=Opuntia streptacantha TaxID=393608 RepID=A0A7C9EWK1_OPUST
MTYRSHGLSGNSGDLALTCMIRPSHQLPSSSPSFFHQTWHLSLTVQFLLIAASNLVLSMRKSGKLVTSGKVNLNVFPKILELGSTNSRVSLQQLSPDPGTVEYSRSKILQNSTALISPFKHSQGPRAEDLP